MAKEFIDYGYTGSVSLPKEIKDMKTAVLKIGGVGLSLKQIVAILVGGTLAFVSFRLLTAMGFETLSIVVPILLALPCIAFAFVKRNGLDFDDYLIVMWANKKQSSAVRKNNLMSEYEKLEDLHDRARRTEEKKQQKRQMPKRKTKEFSKYKAFT